MVKSVVATLNEFDEVVAGRTKQKRGTGASGKKAEKRVFIG